MLRLQLFCFFSPQKVDQKAKKNSWFSLNAVKCWTPAEFSLYWSSPKKVDHFTLGLCSSRWTPSSRSGCQWGQQPLQLTPRGRSTHPAAKHFKHSSLVQCWTWSVKLKSCKKFKFLKSLGSNKRHRSGYQIYLTDFMSQFHLIYL